MPISDFRDLLASREQFAPKGSVDAPKHYAYLFQTGCIDRPRVSPRWSSCGPHRIDSSLQSKNISKRWRGTVRVTTRPAHSGFMDHDFSRDPHRSGGALLLYPPQSSSCVLTQAELFDKAWKQSICTLMFLATDANTASVQENKRWCCSVSISAIWAATCNFVEPKTSTPSLNSTGVERRLSCFLPGDRASRKLPSHEKYLDR